MRTRLKDRVLLFDEARHALGGGVKLPLELVDAALQLVGAAARLRGATSGASLETLELNEE